MTILSKTVSRPYNKRVTPRVLKVGNLVVKATWHVQKGLKVSKFAPKLARPYIVTEANDSGHYLIFWLNLEGHLAPTNKKLLKLFYPM